MSPSEYKELIDFLGPKFDRIDQRFDKVEKRLDRVEGRLTGVEGRLTGVEVLFEQNRKEIRLLAESLKFYDEKMDAFRDEVRAEFVEVRAKMKAGFDAIHARVDRLEAA